MQKSSVPTEVQLAILIAAGYPVFLTEEGRLRILDAFPEPVGKGGAALV